MLLRGRARCDLRVMSIKRSKQRAVQFAGPPLECQREQNGQTFRNFLWEKRLGEGELRQYGESSVAKKRRKYSPSAGRDVESEMRRYKRGTAKSGRGGKGGKVKSRKQAIAIGLSKARKKGKRVPKKKR